MSEIVSEKLDRAVTVGCILLGLTIFFIADRMNLPGKGIVAAAFAASDLVCLYLYRRNSPFTIVAACLAAIIVIQIAILYFVSESTGLYHGFNIYPISIASFLVFSSFIHILRRLKIVRSI